MVGRVGIRAVEPSKSTYNTVVTTDTVRNISQHCQGKVLEGISFFKLHDCYGGVTCSFYVWNVSSD